MAKSILSFHESGDESTVQLCYDLPHRVHDVLTYPIKAPNGSSIILYGNQRGLRLLWVGGRPLKQKKAAVPPAAPKAKTNGNVSVVIDLDDSDDDKSVGAKAFKDTPEFEADKPELYVEQGVVIQDLDLDLGAAVTQISAPNITGNVTVSAAPHERILLAQRLVVGVCCDDGVVRIITLPLAPPSHESKARPELSKDYSLACAGHGTWGETVVKLPSVEGYTAKHTRISVTFSPAMKAIDNEESPVKGKDGGPKPQLTAKPRPGEIVPDSDLLVASCSEQFSGVLFVYRVPLEKKKGSSDDDLDLSTKDNGIWQLQNLNSCARSLSFNTASYLRPQHSQLLVADFRGSVLVYATNSPDEDQGSWLVTLYAPYHSTSHFSSMPQRKQVVDAKWILSGRAIFALLEDGTWGIWDLEGSLVQKINKALTVSTFSSFVLTGSLDASVSRSAHSTSQQPLSSKRASTFAPLTPGARRTENSSLFGASASNSRSMNDQSQPSLRGGVNVILSEDASDESVIVHHAGSLFMIPNIQQYINAQTKGSQSKASNTLSNSRSGGSLFGPPSAPSADTLLKIDALTLRGENITATSLSFFATSATIRQKNAPQSSIIVAAEHRLYILYPREHGHVTLREEKNDVESDEDDTMDVDDAANDAPNTAAAQRRLLDEGAMTVDGIDKVLNSLDADHLGGRGSSGSALPALGIGSGPRRKVEFR